MIICELGDDVVIGEPGTFGRRIQLRRGAAVVFVTWPMSTVLSADGQHWEAVDDYLPNSIKAMKLHAGYMLLESL